MKKVMTTLGCIALAFIGYWMTRGESNPTGFKQNTIVAATVPSWNYNGQLPLDIMLDQAKRVISDTVIVHDTVKVTNTKRVKVSVPKPVTDTIYVSMDTLLGVNVVGSVKNTKPECDEPEDTKVTLIIDGKTVYSSEADIQDTDGLQEP